MTQTPPPTPPTPTTDNPTPTASAPASVGPTPATTAAPADSAQSQSQSQPSQAGSAQTGAGKTILLAEDDHVLQAMYQERLKAEGFNVILAVDGEQALAQVEQTVPALIILDVMMPKMNGIDVLKKLKSSEKTKNIPVIVATALVQDMTELKKQLTANDAYLIKSEVMPGDVVKLVREKLSGSTAPTVAKSSE